MKLKYLLCLYINLTDPLCTNNEYKLGIFDSRELAMKYIEDDIIKQKDANNRDFPKNETTTDPYNITELGTYVKWHDKEGREWYYSYAIYPIPENPTR